MEMMATTEVAAPEVAVVEVMVRTLKAVESNMVMIRQQQQLLLQLLLEKTVVAGKKLLDAQPLGQMPPEAVVYMVTIVLRVLHT